MRKYSKHCQAKKITRPDSASTTRPAALPRALMIQGTASNVGKSTLVVALAAALKRRGLRVYPFKPQNMSNNAAAVAGGEIARAQALQAQAAGVAAEVAMNPILLKPQGSSKSQLVVMGKAKGTISGNQWRSLRLKYGAVVKKAFESLMAKADIVLVEGAGSPAEINLRKGDIANMGFATMAGVPTILVADIHQGGSGASIVGTTAFLNKAERSLLKGYVLNRFRGSKSLLGSLPAEIKKRCGLECVGVFPYSAAAADLPLEDSLALDTFTPKTPAPTTTIRKKITVARLPLISNFDDIDPLRADNRFEVEVVDVQREPLRHADVVLLCGSKAVRQDLAVLKKSGWDIDLKAHLRRGGVIVGICGGYQMLGEEIADPYGLEGPRGKTRGLGLLPIKTSLTKGKRVSQCEAAFKGFGSQNHNIKVKGYLIHQGKSIMTNNAEPFIELANEIIGIKKDGVYGGYLHGMFNCSKVRDALCGQTTPPSQNHDEIVSTAINELATLAENHLDLDQLIPIKTPLP